MKICLPHFISHHVRPVVLAAVLLGCLGSHAGAEPVVPDNQKALLTVKGQGASPFAQISLSTGPQQTLVTKADESGQFLFSNLKYASFSDLKFAIDIPPSEKGLSQSYPANHLQFVYDANESLARISGQIGKSGTLAFNLGGAQDSMVQVAGDEGYVDLQTRTFVKMSSGLSTLTASIVNVGEVCCPNMLVPAVPITLVISSQPVTNIPVPQPQLQSPVGNRQKNNAPALLKYTKPNPTEPQPSNRPQDTNSPETLPPQKPNKNIPYLVQGHLKLDDITIYPDDIVSAVGFPAATYEATYVGGIKRMADEARNAVLLNIAAIGTMIDARTFSDTMRSLQISTVQTLKNYTSSDSVCRYGTLSRSLASADAGAKKNQLAFSKILMDRDAQKKGGLYASPAAGVVYLLENFKDKYCESSDNGTFLEGYCSTASDTADLLYNRDVDFTRVFDIPLTIDADFTEATLTNDKQSIIALFDNLSKIPPILGANKDAFDPSHNSQKTQDIRSLAAMRTMTANSFGALVGEKTKSTAASATHMYDILVQLGVSTSQATKLLGANPSYFAQMEVLTKKLFQDPSFYVNLYDGEANVDRQRVAMKAIELQQERDFLESLRRREMLLSVLLNSKLKTTADRSNESGFTNNN